METIIGTVDAINGLIAVLSDRSRSRSEEEGVKFNQLEEGLNYLATQKEYRLIFDYRSLENILFMGGVFGGIIDSYNGFYTPAKSSQRIMQRGISEFGEGYREYVERMTDDFEGYLRQAV